MWARSASTNISSDSLASIASCPASRSSLASMAASSSPVIHPQLRADTGACTIRGSDSSNGLNGRLSQAR